MSQKIAVLGPIPYDHIVTAQGREIVKYGCVTHPVIALARLLEGEGTVYPVAHIRKKDRQDVEDIFSPYDNIELDALHDYMDQGDVIQLRFVDQNNRLEKQTAFMPPIAPKDVDPVLDADLFVCVPITDYEVPLPTLQYIHQHRKPNALTIFDAHGPTTTVTTEGERLRRFWMDRDLWLPYIDILKMNIEEAACCWFRNEYTEEELKEGIRELTVTEMADFGAHVLEQGVKALFITLDARGAAVFWHEDGRVKQSFVSSVPVDEVIDTTGCGDSFAGGIAFGLLDDRDTYLRAARYANALGALRTQGTTFSVFKSRSETEEMMEGHYGEL